MKKGSLIGILTFVILFQASAQNEYSQDVSSIDNLIATLYSVISGEKGESRDWDRFKNLFAPDARLIPSGKNNEGQIGYRIMTSLDYVVSAGKRLEEVGFHELEINRKTEEYGSLVHVWSTYESYHSKSDKAPFTRGINSIQLLNDGNRWWILQIYWLGESAENPLPKKYLPKKNE